MFPKFNGNYKPADPRRSTNLKQKMTPGHLTIKPLKTRDKGEIFKSHQMQRNVTHRKTAADEALEAAPDRRQRPSLKREREKDRRTTVLSPAHVSFDQEGKIKTFSDTQELKERTANRPARNVTGGHSGERQIPDGNLDLHRRMKSTRNHNYVDI